MLPQAYQVAEVVKAGSYTYYGAEYGHWKLTFATGEVVVMDKRNDAPIIQSGDSITGIITDDVVKLSSGSYAKFKVKALPKEKDGKESRVDITGTSLYLAWVEVNKVQPMTPEDFIADFRKFQELLK